MNTKFLFFRHANAYPGTPDNIQLPTTHLNSQGDEMAQKLGKRILAMDLADPVILCSPYQRTKDTMQLATKGVKLKPVFMDELIEIGSNFWPNPDKLHNDRSKPEPKSYKSTQKAVLKTFNSLWKENKGKTVLVFTHGNLIRCLVSALMGSGWKGLNRLVINLASVTSIEEGEGGEPLITSVSDTGHL